MKKVLLLLVTVFMHAQQSFGAAIESARCSQANDSLDGEQAKLRNAWALKCYPDMKYTADENGNFQLFDAQAGTFSIAYPIFIQVDLNGNLVQYVPAPIDPAAACWDTNVYKFAGYCRAGCFTPDQQILFSQGYVGIRDAKEQGLSSIVTYNGSVKGELTYRNSELLGYTVDTEEYNQPILVVRTASGGEVRVTPNHPLVDGRGFMVSAETLKVGDSLMNMDGQKDAIQSIDTIDYFGKVYNIDMGTDVAEDNVIVAQGYLSGTVYFQNEGLENLNRLVLRESNLLTEEMLK